MTPYDIIRKFPEIIIPKATAGLRKTIQYKTEIPLYVVIDDGKCTVHDGYAETYDIGLSMKDDILMGLFTGKVNGTTAFLTKKLKIEGDMSLAQRIPTFFDITKVI